MDSSIPDWPAGLPTPLLGRSHTIQPRSEVTRMESGRPRVRAADRECLEVMNATWNFTGDQYNTFRDFFINELEHGEKVFELVTLEQDSDPTQIRQVVREVAFLDATYTFNRSDNLFTVEAELEIDAEEYAVIDNPFNPPPPTPENPDLPYIYISTCRDIIEFSWELSPGFTPGEDVLETALSEEGPWFEYVVAVPTVEQLAAGVMEVQVNNSFDGARWFRLVRNGEEILAAVNPVGSVVAMPTALAVDNTDDSPYGLHMTPLGTGQEAGDSEPFTRPLSYIENALANPTRVYVEPVGRVEYNRGQNFSGLTNAVAADSGASLLRWTRDGSDPTAEMAWPPPKYEGVDFNARAYTSDFAFAIRARCFSGECRSPLALLLVDRRHDFLNSVRTIGSSGGFLGSCDLTRLDADGNPQESGFSCLVNHGGTGVFETVLDELACNNLLFGSTLLLSGKPALFRLSHSTRTGTSWMLWPSFVVINSKWLMSIFEPTGLRPASFYDQVPLVFEYVETTVGTSYKEKVAGPNADGNPQAGMGGSLASHCGAVYTFLASHVPGCTGMANVSGVIDSFEVIFSLHDDDAFTVPTEPPTLPPEPPSPPEPPAIEVFEESWEEYLDTETPELEVLNGGTGWDAPWVFNEPAITSGYDLMDDYVDGSALATTLVGGEGWVTSWVFNDNGPAYTYGENWESYTDQVIAPGVLLRDGAGWDLFDLVLGIQVSWTFNNTLAGQENWESYIDQVITGSTVLNNNTDLSWTAIAWTFND